MPTLWRVFSGLITVKRERTEFEIENKQIEEQAVTEWIARNCQIGWFSYFSLKASVHVPDYGCFCWNLTILVIVKQTVANILSLEWCRSVLKCGHSVDIDECWLIDWLYIFFFHMCSSLLQSDGCLIDWLIDSSFSSLYFHIFIAIIVWYYTLHSFSATNSTRIDIIYLSRLIDLSDWLIWVVCGREH